MKIRGSSRFHDVHRHGRGDGFYQANHLVFANRDHYLDGLDHDPGDGSLDRGNRSDLCFDYCG